MLTYTEIPADWPLLGGLQLLPLLTGLALIRLRGEPALWLALATAALQIALATALYLGFDSSLPVGVMQYAETVPLWGAFHYHTAVDGMSVLFVLLTALLGFLCVVFILLRKLHGSSVLAVMFGVQAVLISQFVTLDLLWFSLMSLLEVVLVAYLTKRWPTAHDVLPALTRFLAFMGMGLLLLLAATLLLGWNYADIHGYWSFDLYQLTDGSLQEPLDTLVFFLLFYALAIRIPLFPLHGWLPDFIQHGNVAIAPIYLLGVKVGVYGLLRFVLPITPRAVWEWHTVAVGFAVLGVFYAALLALRQQNLRSLLAFAVVSHSSILIIGLFSLHPVALQGSVLLALNTGLAVSGLLLMTGLLWQRTHTTHLSKLGGLFDTLPLVGIAFLVAGLAIVGMPGTPGFNAVHFVLEGAIEVFGAPVSIAAALGNLIAAGFLLHAFQRTFLSQTHVDHSRWDQSPLQLTEGVLAGTVILITLIAGFYDAPWLQLVVQPVGGLSDLFVEWELPQ